MLDQALWQLWWGSVTIIPQRISVLLFWFYIKSDATIDCWVIECSISLLEEKIVHPSMAQSWSWESTHRSSFYMKYPSIVNKPSLQFFPQIRWYHITCQSSWEGMPVSWPPAIGKRWSGTKLWKDLITSIQELIGKERNPDFQAILSPTLGLVSHATGKGKARKSTVGF